MPELHITLPNDIASAVKAKVQSGEYATESEVLCDGLDMLFARDQAVEDWLYKQVAPAYDALKENPSTGLSADQVRASLAARHAKRQ